MFLNVIFQLIFFLLTKTSTRLNLYIYITILSIIMLNFLLFIRVQASFKMRTVSTSIFSRQVMCRWTLSVKKNYREVKYHNWRHALNVAQTMFAILKTGKIEKFMSDLEVSQPKIILEFRMKFS